MEIQYPEFSLLFILFSIFVLATFDQLYYYWYFFRRLAFYKDSEKESLQEGVSVIICAKNEYYNLEKNLPLILSQKFQDFEVIVVNDASDDESEELLKNFERENKHLKVVTIHQNLNFFSGKKFPLSIGIKSAKYDVLLLTDADCSPASDEWLQDMTSGMNNGTDIVLGYAPHQRVKGFLNKIIRYETLHVAMQYLSFSLSGLTYMGVGRNLAYRKSLFFQAKGFMSHYKVSSGDDDLFINSVATKNNTRIEVDPKTYCISKPKTSFKSWFIQKRRHLSAGKFYKPKFKTILGKYTISQLLFYSLLIPLLIANFNFIIVISLFVLRLFSQLFIYKKCMKVLNEKGLLLAIPVMEVFMLILQMTLGLSNVLSKPNKWK